MSQIIYYGAGKNLCDCEKEFIAETGYPICICDASEEKWGTVYTFKEGIEREIVSINRVKQEYPDYELWLTLADHNLEKCYISLLDMGIPKEKIRLFGNRSYRQGCRMMNNFSYISSDNVKACAHFPYTKVFGFDNEILAEHDIVDAVHKLEQWRIDTIDALKRGEKPLVKGVLRYSMDFMKTNRELHF